MFQVQCPAQPVATPSRGEALIVELDDEQLGLVAGGLLLPVAGWRSADVPAIPVGGW